MYTASEIKDWFERLIEEAKEGVVDASNPQDWATAKMYLEILERLRHEIRKEFN